METDEVVTPENKMSRADLISLLRSNLVTSPDEVMQDVMETDSPIILQNAQAVIKKLFHSPEKTQEPITMEDTSVIMTDDSVIMAETPNTLPRNPRKRKIKSRLFPNSEAGLETAYIELEEFSPDIEEGIKKKVVVSLFHNAEMSMELTEY